MIGGFVAARLATLGHAEMDALEAVMELQDTDLTDWLTGRAPIPPEADSPMLREILVRHLLPPAPGQTRTAALAPPPPGT